MLIDCNKNRLGLCGILTVCLLLIQIPIALSSNPNTKAVKMAPLEMQIKGRGVFRFPDSVTPEEAEKLIRRDFPDMLGSAQPLPNFAQKEQAQLRIHEGETRNNKGQHVSYPDSLGNLTGGIGHLMSEKEQKKFPIGTAIPDSTVDKWFTDDTKKAEAQTDRIIKSFALEEAPDEVKQILFNMSFNLGEGTAKGRTGLNSFVKMLPALSRKDYRDAAKEMKDSEWFTQVKSRGVDLVSRMNAVADPLDNPPGVKFASIPDTKKGEKTDV